jgi:hypothetical protein
MKTKEEIEKLAEEFYPPTTTDLICSPKLVRLGYMKGYIQCQEDMKQEQLSDKVLFEQAILAMEEHYGSGCETEIDAYFRGLKWMQEQLNKQE